MAQTATLSLTGNWVELTAGPAVVTLTTDIPGGRYAFREDAGAPSDTVQGHHLPFQEDRSLQLETGTRLYVRGRNGNLSWSRDDI